MWQIICKVDAFMVHLLTKTVHYDIKRAQTMYNCFFKSLVGQFILFFCTAILFAADVPPPEYPGSGSNQVFYLPQFTEFESISEKDMRFFRKTLLRAEEARAKALILELDTPGGSVETAFKYLSIMENARLPVIVYLKPNGISAGMIIALGADRVAISPNGIIGDAMPVSMGLSGMRPITDKPQDGSSGKKVEKTAQKKSEKQPEQKKELFRDLLKEIGDIRNGSNESEEEKQLAEQKFLTVFFKMLDVLAAKNTRPAKVIRAMADPYTVLSKEQDGIAHDKRSPLTLSAAEAHKLGVVDYVVRDQTELLKKLGLENAELLTVTRTPTEQLGEFLATPALAGLLLIIGLIGIFVEVKTPGFGVPGVLGVAALTLFFLGHIAAGTSDWGPLVVFFVGLLLIALEIFVIPGFGLVGVLGTLCVLVSFFWAFGFENIDTAVKVVTLSLLIAVTTMILLAVYVLPKTPVFRRTALEKSMTVEDGFQAKTADSSLIGATAVTVTPLRLSGVVRIGDKRHEAVSEGDYIEADKLVTVTACNGFQLVVRENNSAHDETSVTPG